MSREEKIAFLSGMALTAALTEKVLSVETVCNSLSDAWGIGIKDIQPFVVAAQTDPNVIKAALQAIAAKR